MTETDIRQKIKDVIADVSDIAVADIGDQAAFVEDLGLDSLVMLEISVDIELQFDLEVPEDVSGFIPCKDAVISFNNPLNGTGKPMPPIPS